ncbi:ubiquinone anaerobic biosynthesis accessory factor UbiT [Colwellia psychrerythraea]|uniref:Ubiquinone biosynthesis accessory factor UbiT n=1 Tax=Colwellia psychrerythraea TaxID=28229 RepID=A0A099KJV3_COLPS|nr:SCP2 sterol-binding domain-containing protein [Colwellia psychrerythraea]KGJ89883.1 Sterol-binding domain protein [Colwellia psychrerythraea]
MLKIPTLLATTKNITSSLSRIEQKLPSSFKNNLIKLMPKILRPSLRFVPFSAQKSLLIPALHSIYNEAIEDGYFEFLQGKWLKISIIDLELDWWLSFDQDQLIMAAPDDNIAEDVSFSANGDDLILIAGRKQDPDTLFFQRRLKMEGDTELGLEVKNLIDAIDIEQLPSSVHSLVDFSANFLQNTRDELTKQSYQVD